jgi:hypothetical protein
MESFGETVSTAMVWERSGERTFPVCATGCPCDLEAEFERCDPCESERWDGVGERDDEADRELVLL